MKVVLKCLINLHMLTQSKGCRASWWHLCALKDLNMQERSGAELSSCISWVSSVRVAAFKCHSRWERHQVVVHYNFIFEIPSRTDARPSDRRVQPNLHRCFTRHVKKTQELYLCGLNDPFLFTLYGMVLPEGNKPLFWFSHNPFNFILKLKKKSN